VAPIIPIIGHCVKNLCWDSPMLFSGVVQRFRCSACERGYSHIIPTSIVPLLLTLLVACSLWTGFMIGVFGDYWFAYLIALAASCASIPTFYFLLQKTLSPWVDTRVCPKCRIQLEVVGGGFVDGAPPSAQELMLYLLVIGVPLLL
jgi:hypothetical protein